jgi:branched-chain amino acid transport system substrate-binding protein
MRKLFILLGLLTICSILITGCSANVSSTEKPVTSSPPITSQSGPLTPSESSSSTPSQPTQKVNTSENSLKIGFVCWKSNAAGYDSLRCIEAMVDMINKSGGLSVGGKVYSIKLIAYDTENNQASATAAVNRLIFEDHVQFIVGESFVDAWNSITEANKVIVSAHVPTPMILNPKNKYSFNTSFLGSQPVIATGWFVKVHPDKKNFMLVGEDIQLSHMILGTTGNILKSFGLNVQEEFYPANQTDLTAVGTKIATINPDVVMTLDVAPIKFIRESGWKGYFFSGLSYTADYLLSRATAEQLEGYMGGAWPVEFEPALTPTAQKFKEAYVAKNGKWDGPEVNETACFSGLIAAIQKADSLETDKVAAAFSSGLEFECPCGPVKMVSRPDKGNDRTIDSVAGGYIKAIEGGKPVLIDTISLTDALGYFQQYLTNAAAMPGPAGPPKP